MSPKEMGCESRTFISLAEFCAIVVPHSCAITVPHICRLAESMKGRRILDQLFNHRNDYKQFRFWPEIHTDDVR